MATKPSGSGTSQKIKYEYCFVIISSCIWLNWIVLFHNFCASFAWFDLLVWATVLLPPLCSPLHPSTLHKINNNNQINLWQPNNKVKPKRMHYIAIFSVKFMSNKQQTTISSSSSNSNCCSNLSQQIVSKLSSLLIFVTLMKIFTNSIKNSIKRYWTIMQ